MKAAFETENPSSTPLSDSKFCDRSRLSLCVPPQQWWPRQHTVGIHGICRTGSKVASFQRTQHSSRGGCSVSFRVPALAFHQHSSLMQPSLQTTSLRVAIIFSPASPPNTTLAQTVADVSPLVVGWAWVLHGSESAWLKIPKSCSVLNQHTKGIRNRTDLP